MPLRRVWRSPKGLRRTLRAKILSHAQSPRKTMRVYIHDDTKRKRVADGSGSSIYPAEVRAV